MILKVPMGWNATNMHMNFVIFISKGSLLLTWFSINPDMNK